MTCENIGFADPLVAKEAVGRLGVGPVLTCPRRGCTYFMRQLLQKLSQSLAMPNILKLASHHFIVYPFFRPEIRRRLPALHALTLSQLPHGNYFAINRPHTVSIWLEAEYDPSITNQTRPELWVIERLAVRLHRLTNWQSTKRGRGFCAVKVPQRWPAPP